MVFGALIGAAVGIGTSIFSGNQQANAARDANDQQEKIAEAQYQRALKEWEIDYQTRVTNWMWETAKLEAQKFSERQAKADYEWRQGKLIESAERNLAVNEAALMDKFGTEEDLRMRQVNLELDFNQAKLAADSNEQLRQYLVRINDRALASQQLVQQSNTEGQQLAIDATLGFQKDALERDIQSVAAAVGASSARAVASQRQGGGSSSQRLALNSIQELGRTYGMIEMNNRSRQSRIQQLNSTIRGERATQLGRYAIATADDANRMKFTKGKYERDSGYNLDVFRDLTMPSFELATRQGERELESLYIQTESTIDQASQPFRESIWFDPLEPVAGLKPEYMAPTKIYEPTGIDIGLNALGAGIGGAMQFSYQKPGGGLGFY